MQFFSVKISNWGSLNSLIFVKNYQLKKYYILYKPFLLFLGKFLVSYLALTIAYQVYLNQFDLHKFEIDGVTKLVAQQSKDLLLLFNYDAKITPSLRESAMLLLFNGKTIARIIEGCNGISVIILFVAFIIAFSAKKRSTFLYIVMGCALIYIANVIRISLLCALLYFYPEQEHFLHSVLFPLFIYGLVFLLWVIWLFGSNKISKYTVNETEK